VKVCSGKWARAGGANGRALLASIWAPEEGCGSLVRVGEAGTRDKAHEFKTVESESQRVRESESQRRKSW